MPNLPTNPCSSSVLRVETGYLSPQAAADGPYLDYHVYEDCPKWLRRIEKILRMDFFLALKAKEIARNYDLVWARSELVGIPLSFIGLNKPLVVSAHYLESPCRTFLLGLTGIARKWAAVGYYSDSSRDFLTRQLGIDPERLFFSENSNHLHIDPGQSTYEGPIISLGVAKRDYPTLLDALSRLDGFETELFAFSKFGNRFSRKIRGNLPPWVRIMGYVPEEAIHQCYQCARFVVIPLLGTKHPGAGMTVAMEAGAFGKAVIATHTPGMETFVLDGRTGLLVPPNDVEAMRNAITRLWNDPESAKEMGRQARQYIETRFNHGLITRQREGVFERIFAAQREASG